MPLYKRGEYWWVSVGVSGQRIRKSTGCKKKSDARKVEDKIRSDILRSKQGLKPEYSLAQAVKRWMEEETPSNKQLSHCEALFPYIEGKLLTDAVDVSEDYKKANKHLRPATINKRIGILKRICNLAYKKWGILDQPLGLKISKLPEDNERHIYLTRDQVNEVANNCGNPAAGDAIRFVSMTGLRRSEFFRLTRSNLVDGCIVLDARTKTGKPRVIPLPEDAISIAERLPLPLSDRALRTAFEIGRESIGMPWLHFHDLRHTYASWAIQTAGVSLKIVGMLLGHSETRTTDRYAHLETEHLKKAVDNIFKKSENE